jgi:sulfoxide reductase heme-binding subunit YedZ
MRDNHKNSWKLWRDRRGHLSRMRIVVLALLLFPLLKAIYDSTEIMHGARPINDLIHRAGFWSLIFLGATLLVTPMRFIGRYGQLIDVRRMLGVGAFFYIAAHLSLYVADQAFDLAKVFHEISHRVYLIVGAVAWIGLAVLAITSTDKMVRRLGGMRWRRLHQTVYVIVLLSLIHYFQQTKADVTVPILVAGLFLWLIAYRVLAWFLGTKELSTVKLLGLSIAVSAITFVGEAVGLGIEFHVSPLRVLETAFNFDAGIRPGWQVLGAGIVVVLFDAVRARWSGKKSRRRQEPVAAQ